MREVISFLMYILDITLDEDTLVQVQKINVDLLGDAQTIAKTCLPQEVYKLQAEIAEKAAEIDKQAAEIDKQAAEIDKQATKSVELAAEIDKQAAEIDKLAAEKAELDAQLALLQRNVNGAK